MGVMVYGETPEAAAATTKALALRVLADRIDAGEISSETLRSVDFVEHKPLATVEGVETQSPATATRPISQDHPHARGEKASRSQGRTSGI